VVTQLHLWRLTQTNELEPRRQRSGNPSLPAAKWADRAADRSDRKPAASLFFPFLSLFGRIFFPVQTI